MNIGVALLTNVVMAGALADLKIIALKPDMFEHQLEAIFQKEKLALSLRAFRTGLAHDFGDTRIDLI